MTALFLKAFFLVMTFVAAAFAGSDAWSANDREDRKLSIVIRPAVNLEASNQAQSSGEVTLAEIVDVATIPVSERDAVMRHLQSVALTDRPKVGEERTFTQEGLEAIVSEASRRLEAAGYSVTWKIPTRSHILRKNTFTRETVSAELKRLLADRCGGCEVVLGKIEWPRIDEAMIHSWRLNMRSEKPRGNFAIPIEFELLDSAGRESSKTMMLSGKAEFFAQVPITTRGIQAGEKLNTADYKRERRNVTFALDAASDPADFERSVTARGLAVGEPIWKASIRREQLVRFGDPVRVELGGETWRVFSEGISQGAAALGETVRVKVGKSQKLVSGVLKEKGLVEIQ